MPSPPETERPPGLPTQAKGLMKKPLEPLRVW